MVQKICVFRTGHELRSRGAADGCVDEEVRGVCTAVHHQLLRAWEWCRARGELSRGRQGAAQQDILIVSEEEDDVWAVVTGLPSRREWRWRRDRWCRNRRGAGRRWHRLGRWYNLLGPGGFGRTAEPEGEAATRYCCVSRRRDQTHGGRRAVAVGTFAKFCYDLARCERPVVCCVDEGRVALALVEKHIIPDLHETTFFG